MLILEAKWKSWIVETPTPLFESGANISNNLTIKSD